MPVSLSIAAARADIGRVTERDRDLLGFARFQVVAYQLYFATFERLAYAHEALFRADGRRRYARLQHENRGIGTAGGAAEFQIQSRPVILDARAGQLRAEIPSDGVRVRHVSQQTRRPHVSQAKLRQIAVRGIDVDLPRLDLDIEVLTECMTDAEHGDGVIEVTAVIVTLAVVHFAEEAELGAGFAAAHRA